MLDVPTLMYRYFLGLFSFRLRTGSMMPKFFVTFVRPRHSVGITVRRTLMLPPLVAKPYKKAIYFFEMSVLFETGELNAYVYDGGGLYRRKYVRTESKGRQRRSLSRTESFSCA